MGKKKANGEGSISKRTDGRYMGRYTANEEQYMATLIMKFAKN